MSSLEKQPCIQVRHSGHRRSTITSSSPWGSHRRGCRRLDPQLGQTLRAATERDSTVSSDGTRIPVPRTPHAPGRIRTCDFCLRRAALYPLSYGRLGCRELSVGGHADRGHLRHPHAARVALAAGRTASPSCAPPTRSCTAGTSCASRCCARSRGSGRRSTACTATSTTRRCGGCCRARGGRGSGARGSRWSTTPGRGPGGSRACGRASRTPTPSCSATPPAGARDADDGFQIFNPGSPTERRSAPEHTMGIATVEDGQVRFELSRFRVAPVPEAARRDLAARGGRRAGRGAAARALRAPRRAAAGGQRGREPRARAAAAAGGLRLQLRRRPAQRRRLRPQRRHHPGPPGAACGRRSSASRGVAAPEPTATRGGGRARRRPRRRPRPRTPPTRVRELILAEINKWAGAREGAAGDPRFVPGHQRRRARERPHRGGERHLPVGAQEGRGEDAVQAHDLHRLPDRDLGARARADGEGGPRLDEEDRHGDERALARRRVGEGRARHDAAPEEGRLLRPVVDEADRRRRRPAEVVQPRRLLHGPLGQRRRHGDVDVGRRRPGRPRPTTAPRAS